MEKFTGFWEEKGGMSAFLPQIRVVENLGDSGEENFFAENRINSLLIRDKP